jgi:3-mercaptopyruvate sulfurtransferase SseA
MAQDRITGNLVNVEWLDKNLSNADVLILDASPGQVYNAQHIPGALSVNLFMYGIQEKPAAEVEQIYQSWGISPGKKVVLYDEGGSSLAASQFYSLYYYGFPVTDILILDGGLFKWKEAGLPVTKDPAPLPHKGTFKITSLKEDIRVRLPEFLNASGDPDNNALIEGLDANWHFGQVAVFDRSGHIPNGILMPGSDFYNPDKTFKSVEEIKKMLDYLRVKPENQIYTYCGGGVNASIPFFALKFILQYPKVKLYKESEMGWLQDERRLPYWTYDAPFLMREANWLQFWGGSMLRMYGISNVSIVDVRNADEYKKGHLPYALNIPADEFTNSLTNPGKLAEVLGPAGVNESDEAVVISGAGLSKESALAFVMLEKLGQKKVSVLIDSLDKWQRLGFALINDPTIVGAKKAPNDLSIPPTNYSLNLHKDIIIADPKSTEGYYPKVIIASGKNLPSKTLDGKIIHIPYSDLMNNGSTPKAAKDIWNILAKAGVPRYAELVCYSDDPGEAAVNYFILKLMGYPDVKVLTM